MGNFRNELTNYQTIPREVVFDSSLSDRARFVYIFMACKPEGWDFFLEPMAKEIGYSVDTLRKYINELVDSGWLVKGEQTNANGKFGAVEYTLKATKFSDTEKTRHGKIPTQDNIDILEKQDNKKEENIKRKSYSDDFEQAWELYKRKGTKSIAYNYWKRLSNKDRQKALAHIPFYIQSNEIQYIKDFNGYLNRRYFDRVIYDKRGNVVFDPERETATTYRPTTGGALTWNDYYKCYIYTSMFIEDIADGYCDDNRPNGATIMLNNGRGIIKWDSESRQWQRDYGNNSI